MGSWDPVIYQIDIIYGEDNAPSSEIQERLVGASFHVALGGSLTRKKK